MIALEAGAGKVIIEELKAKKLDFDLGAGKVEIDNLLVLDDAEIDGGAGAIKITNSAINNLELDLGVGKLELTSKLTGYNKIDSGIGETNIDLVGNESDYKIKVEKDKFIIASFVVKAINKDDVNGAKISFKDVIIGDHNYEDRDIKVEDFSLNLTYKSNNNIPLTIIPLAK